MVNDMGYDTVKFRKHMSWHIRKAVYRTLNVVPVGICVYMLCRIASTWNYVYMCYENTGMYSAPMVDYEW